MALKPYSSRTLNSGWFEDRAPPLKGIYPMHGPPTNYDTVSKTSFVNPHRLTRSLSLAGKEMLESRQRGGGPVKMCQIITYPDAVRERKTDRPEVGFGAILPKHDPKDFERYLKTTAEQAFGANRRHLRAELRRIKNLHREAAKGRSGARAEKGLACSGVLGEVFVEKGDPRKDTIAQRSWTYDLDPMVKTRMKYPDGIPQSEIPEGMSLQIGYEMTGIKPKTDLRERFARNSSITRQFDANYASTLPGRNIYTDWP